MSGSLVDFLTEKFFSFTSKMRGDSFHHNSVSYFTGGGNKSTHQWDPVTSASVLRQSGVLDFDITNPYPYNQAVVLDHHYLGIFDSNNIFNSSNNLKRPECFYHPKSGHFSPQFSILNYISDLNSFCYKTPLSDMSFFPCPSTFIGNMSNMLGESLKYQPQSMDDSRVKAVCNSPKSEFTVSVQVSHSTPKKSEEAAENCNSANLKMNLKLANRKTRQMNKRSKKRRRRQKKSQPSVGNTGTFSDDSESDVSPGSSCVTFVTDSPKFGCSISVQCTTQRLSRGSTFVVPVQSDTDDDSQWETYDETDLSNSHLSTSSSEVSSSNSSPVKSKSSGSRCTAPNGFISIISFVGNSSEDESDWESSESDNATDTSEFEFTGLFVTNLCTQRTQPSNCNLAVDSEEETDECVQLKKMLKEVNKNWDELTRGDDKKLRSATKVTFAAEEDLVEVCPVDMCERKGEWEIYATERMRFKRKIDEMEKVLSPCLNPEHRSKVLKRLLESEL